MEKDKGRRLLKVGQAVQNELSLMLLKDTKDPALLDVTISGVKMAKDLTRAKVFYSLLDINNKLRVQRSLKRAAPFFQGKIGQILQLRHTPVLHFVFDETPQKSARINDIVAETELDRQKSMMNQSPEQQLAKKISTADSILIGCHRKPDADALGSVLAMKKILALYGKQSVAFIPDGISDNLKFLPGCEDVVSVLETDFVPELTIMLDTASLGQFPEPLRERYDAHTLGHIAVVDHHAQCESFGHTVVRREISATGELLFALVNELVWPMDDDVAVCMYAAIIADTGCFRYSNTTQSTFETAAQLLQYDVSASKIAKQLFDTVSLARQRVLAKVAQTLEIDESGKYASLFCTQEMMNETGAVPSDLEGFVNMGRNVVGVEAAVLFTETKDGSKASLRSNGNVDVASVAAEFGGGGHRAAAGITLKNVSLDDAKKQVKNALRKVL